MPLKILVVDDDLLLQNSLAYQLKTEGYTVMIASTSAEALALARVNRPDLILLDIGLPDRDGLATARLLDRELKAPIIFLTARNQETDVVIGLELGASVYGGHCGLRNWLEAQPLAYVLAVSSKDTEINLQGWPQRVSTWLADLPSEGWTRLGAGDGSKGPPWMSGGAGPCLTHPWLVGNVGCCCAAA